MKRSWQCPKCESKRIGYLEEVADLGEPYASAATSQAEPRRVLIAKVPQKGLLGGTSMTSELVGATEAFICADCGFFEEYIKSPSEVPWASVAGFRWCRPEAS